MSSRFKLQLVVMADDNEVCVDDVVVLDKQHERLEHIGRSLGEAKTVLLELQRQVVTRQIAAFLATRAACQICGRRHGIKDRKTVVFRTLFGNLRLTSRDCDAVPASTTYRHRPARWSSYWRSAPRPSWCTWRASGRLWSPTVSRRRPCGTSCQ